MLSQIGKFDLLFATALALTLWASPSWLSAASLTLKDGRILEGDLGMVGGVAESPDSPANKAGGVNVRPILIIDDGLRRTFVSKRSVRQINEAVMPGLEKVLIPQRVADVGSRIGGVGPILRITPFDQFGRRIFSMKTSKGPLHVIQGITEVTPIYTKVEGLQGRRAIVWEMRIGTSSIPRETLSKILHGGIDPTNPNDRLNIVRMYVQAERYKDARLELESIVKDFPDLNQLQDQVRAIRQMGARRLLKEIEMRSEGGQHRFVQTLLKSFPGEGVAGETLQQVREIQARYTGQVDRRTAALKLFDRLTQAAGSQVAERVKPVREELEAELSLDTLDRLAAFERLADDDTLSPGQKLSLAITGWLVGSNNASENLEVALSLYQVRNLVREYLRETLQAKRTEILERIPSQEGGSVEQVARLVANMKPPLDTEPSSPQTPGYYELQIPGLHGEPDVGYHLQLPPEYDPHRRYPIVVTLGGTGSTPLQQLEWWAGQANEGGMRMGQATRHGYIVLAVDWLKPHQRMYEYSSREHHAVLSSLRDACRRFSVDTDHVFLSGHSIGGNAAWDIGLAHPDLWAGVIPVVAVADRYCAHYWENARYVPMYIVAGELDGDKMSTNSRELDRYLRRGYDTTVVEFLGRGHEHFFDEIQRIFDWMNRRERNFFPREFECASMRSWDNYFWWVEMSDFPERSIVHPASWPPARGTRAAKVSGKITNTSVIVKSAAGRVSLWLSPELINFQERVTIAVNGRRINNREKFIQPNLQVLLEDVRTRGDRKHPFWARVDSNAE